MDVTYFTVPESSYSVGEVGLILRSESVPDQEFIDALYRHLKSSPTHLDEDIVLARLGIDKEEHDVSEDDPEYE